jgi:cyclase
MAACAARDIGYCARRQGRSTAAVSRREFVKEAAENSGDQCIVVAIDAKLRPARLERWKSLPMAGAHRIAIEYAREVVRSVPARSR